MSGGDLPPGAFAPLGHEVVDWITEYLETVEALPVLPDVAPGDVRARLPAAPPEEPEDLRRALADFREIVVPAMTHWNHPAFFAWFSITGSAPGILGEMLAAALNVNHMLWRSSPAATELEEVTADWVRQMVGLPAGFDGVINDTASTSTLYALAAARERAYPGSRERGLFGERPCRVYGSAQSHSSVEKAVVALGLGRAAFRAVACDDRFRMDPGALARAIEDDVARGVTPLAVVPTLGTTSVTAMDPVDEIVDAAGGSGAWIHVDAAYGGPAAILPELRDAFRGWERADSVVINPHKWLFTPVDCSLLYCREPATLVRAFSLVPAYLETPEAESRNLMDYGVALGRRFRSLKLWFVLRAFGRKGIEERIRTHVQLARRFAGWVEEEEGWEVVAPVTLALVVFRVTCAGAAADEADRLNQAVVDRVNATGEALLGTTRVDDRTVIRLAVGNLRTEERHLARAWELLRAAAAEEGGAASVGPRPTG